jgi:Protein of unknwon function (DUF3310).
MNDNVDHPQHYNQGSREVIEIIDEILDGMASKLSPSMFFALGNALKYILRHPYKGKPVDDLEKARWYLNHLIGQYAGAEGGFADESN